MPSVASIGRCLHQWPRFRRQSRKKPPAERPSQPTAVHQRWQIDFKIGIELQDSTQVDLHTVRDPVGEACLESKLFPAEQVTIRTERVPMKDVRTTLRACFGRWQTLPDEVQTDGESTLVTSRVDGSPSLFTLWLKGLGGHLQRLLVLLQRRSPRQWQGDHQELAAGRTPPPGLSTDRDRGQCPARQAHSQRRRERGRSQVARPSHADVGRGAGRERARSPVQ